MTIRDSLYFEYGGRRSKDLKMLNVNMDGGMQEEYFASSQSINETKIRGKNKPYFHGVEKDPLSLNVTFAYEETWSEMDLRELRRWLTEPTYYVPLTFSNNNEKIYYVLYEDEPRLFHNALSQGYITLRFRCNDSYAYSPLSASPTYDWTEKNYDITQTEFVNGARNGVVLDNNNKITLNTNFTWNDLVPNISWESIFS